MTKFFEFEQNNSGGSFITNRKLCHRLFIEADKYPSARSKAMKLGVYFYGSQDGIDCSCCGDRWYDAQEINFPHYSGAETIEEVAQYLADEYGWTFPDARIFYLDGSVKEIYKNPKAKD